MRMVISDIPNLSIQKDDELKAPNDVEILHHCIGCFGCWVKTPGECVIKDSYMNMGQQLGKSQELILISKLTYCGVSPFVKNVLDRSIPYISPNFRIVNNEMHHKRRYDNTIKFSAYFYGMDISEKEKVMARGLIHSQVLNFHGKVNEICFFNTATEVKEALSWI